MRLVRIRPYHFNPTPGTWCVYLTDPSGRGSPMAFVGRGVDRESGIREAVGQFRRYLAEVRFLLSNQWRYL